MKLKLLISMLFCGMFYQITAQDLKQSAKPRPANYEYLSAPDSLGIRHQLKMPDIATNKKTLAVERKLPYPIIFIHGLNSSSNTWNTFTDFLWSNFSLRYGGRFDISLNDDGYLTSANKNVYPTTGADIALYSGVQVSGDYYYVNFAVDSGGNFDEKCANLSNQSAIAKQGKALQIVIKEVMRLTGCNKVVLMGHSMGGLAAREYLQNTSNWQIDGQHHIAKLATTGTPHGGSNATGVDLTLISSVLPDPQSEAIRDLRKSYSWSQQAGVFLNGGIESQSIMSDFSLSLNNFYNFDVNCNGIIGENIIGLNQKLPQYNLDYSCVIGNIGLGGDGVVTVESANLNTIYSGITTNVFSTSTNHLNLTSKPYETLQGLDEPNEYNLAYGINKDQLYLGLITEQVPNLYVNNYDFDDYTFTLTSTSQVTVNISNITLPNLMSRIIDVNGNILANSTNGSTSSSMSLLKNLPSGKYYIEIYGTPTKSNTIYQYSFQFTNASLATDDFDLSTDIKIFPNPTTSKVFFDNSNYNFENVSVVNSLGQEVSKNKFSTVLSNQEIDLSSLPSGIYFLKLNNNEKTKTVKVIKE